jgi:hypothetical protein
MHTTGRRAEKVTGIHRNTARNWANLSEQGHPDLQEVEYGGLIKPFHEHLLDCIDESIEDLDAEFRHTSLHGQWVPQIWHGNFCFEDHEAAMAMSEKEFQDACDLGLAWPDKKRRVRNEETGEWERVKIMQFIPPSVDAVTKVLSSYAPETYGDKRSIKMEVNASLGVTVVPPFGVPKRPQEVEVLRDAVTDAIAQIPVETALVEIDDEVEQYQIAPNDDEPEPVEQPEPDCGLSIEVEEPEPEPEPVYPAPSPLTPEQQAILARARSGNGLAADLAQHALKKLVQQPNAAPAATPRPPVSNSSDMDEDDAAIRRPGGVKVV